VVLRAEGTHRSGLEARPCAFGVQAVADDGAKPEPGARIKIFFISVESGARQESKIEAPGPYINAPVFSTDGRYLAFISGSGFLSTDIYVAPVTGGKPRALTSLHSEMAGVAWTQDGRELIFDSDHQGLPTLWRVPFSGGNAEPLGASADYAYGPTVAAHGNGLAFRRFVVDTNIWKAPLSASDHSPPIRIISSTQADHEPAFSPDGRRIAFGSNRSGSAELYVSDADGSNPVQLTSLKNGSTGSPAWSPDGKLIAFDSRAAGHGDIYVISAEGGSPRRLTSGPYDSELPTWSHDGRRIYFDSDRPGSPMWKISADGGEPIQIGNSSGEGIVEGWDGTTVYYFRDGAVWRSDLNGGNETRVIAARDFQNWRVCGAKVCVLDKSSPPSGQLIQYDPVTKRSQSKPLDAGPRVDASTGMDVSPDGRWIIYTRADSIESDIMIVENFH
jgi:Tol biopolymer transport system component